MKKSIIFGARCHDCGTVCRAVLCTRFYLSRHGIYGGAVSCGRVDVHFRFVDTGCHTESSDKEVLVHFVCFHSP